MRLRERLPFHYGWVIVVTGTLTIFSVLGLGRFALGMLLPSMGESLALSYSEMGLISTGNFVGYLAAVLMAGWISQRLGARNVIALGVLLVGGSMLLVGRAGGFVEVLLLYVVTGIGSGAANVPLMGLVSHWFVRRSRGKAAGFIVSGSGYAIIVAGNMIPWINSIVGPEGWRTSWAVQGVISLAIAALAWALLRNDPARMGLRPVGQDTAAPPPPPPADPARGEHRGTMIHLGVVYLLFGATYVVYATFIVTALVQERGFSESVAGTFWAWVGFLSIFSGPAFGAVSDRLGRRAGMMIVYACQSAAYLLVAFSLPMPFLYVSVFLYGVTVWAIPSIMAAAVGDYMGPAHAVKAFGFITLLFSFGQIGGPALAGALADWFDTFKVGFAMIASLAFAAMLLAAFLRRPAEAAEPATSPAPARR